MTNQLSVNSSEIVEHLNFNQMPLLLRELGFKYAYYSKNGIDSVKTLVFEIEGEDVRMQQVLLFNSDALVFSWNGDVLTPLSLLNRVFRKLPEIKKQQLINDHYDPDLHTKDFDRNFLSYICKSSFLTTQKVLLDATTIHNIRLQHTDSNTLSFLYDYSDDFQNYQAHFSLYDPDIRITTPNHDVLDLFRYYLGPLEYEDVVRKTYPGISFYAFDPTESPAAKSNYHALLYIIFYQTYINSKTYKLRSRFNPSLQIDGHFAKRFVTIRTEQTFL